MTTALEKLIGYSWILMDTQHRWLETFQRYLLEPKKATMGTGVIDNILENWKVD